MKKFTNLHKERSGDADRARRYLCGEFGPDDGIDPRDALKADRKAQSPGRSRSGKARHAPSDAPASRKALQLGRQVGEVLDSAFACESRDDLLRNLRVVSVVPAPDASRLIVTVAPILKTEGTGAGPKLILEHLNQAAGRLRTEVAEAITRKRAPLLVYLVDWSD